MAFLEEFEHFRVQLEEIKSATGDFDEGNIIGQGGFGKVYKGVFSHPKGQSMAAFKRLDRKYGQGDPEFLKEILMLSRYTHENLISLLGFCDEDGEKILVYEHASYGSLDRLLSNTTLTWRQRLKICLGAATGVCYLHDPKETQQRVLHRDIKSSNILLDENWNAKVSDMGLSKIGPANQPHSFVPTNVVGTFGYIDPMYMENSILTKESDVYSFGVVLFEVLCGRLCFGINNGHFYSLVRMWKQSYKQKKLDDIIFQDLKQHMIPSSLETFSDIGYRCLHKSLEGRPKMSDVVEKLEIALRLQESFEGLELPVNYEEIGKTAVPPLVYKSKEELMKLLSKGIFVTGGKMWFTLNDYGEHHVMISAAECLVPINVYQSEFGSFIGKKSRFPVEYETSHYWEFKTHVKTHFLSPHITYIIKLVFRVVHSSSYFVVIRYMLAGETKTSITYLANYHEHLDIFGCCETELYQFTTDTRNVDLEITFECSTLVQVEGIEFQPLERVCPEPMYEEEDMQTISLPDTYSEQRLLTDYKDLIKQSKYNVQWTTQKELHSILRKGFPIKDGFVEPMNMVLPVQREELYNSITNTNTFTYPQWFSLDKNGKKCHMLPARVALMKSEWSWRSLPESRFGEVAFDPHDVFWIYIRPNILSPQTDYSMYLVYKLEENHSGFESPVKVSDLDHSWYIFLLSPEIPTIRGKAYRSTHNPSNRPKLKCLPQQRKDGWMEIQVWDFQTSTAAELISKHLRFTLYENKSFKGLIVQGIECKPTHRFL